MINLEIPDRPTICLAHPLYYEQAGRNLLPFRTNFKAALNFKSNSESGKQKLREKVAPACQHGRISCGRMGIRWRFKTLKNFNNMDCAAAAHPCRRLRR